MNRRILSMLLVFAMIFTLVPTALAVTTYQVVTVDKTSVKAGETVNVKVTLPEGIETAGSFTVNLTFDKDKFEVTQRQEPPTLTATNEEYDSTKNVDITANTKADANNNGELTANASYTYNTMKVAGVTVIDATLKAKTDVSGTAAFSFETFEITKSDGGTQYIVKSEQLQTPPSVTILKSPITTLVAPTVTAPEKYKAFPTTVTLDGVTAYTASLEWYEGETATGTPVGSGAKAKPNTTYTAKVTLTAKTADGESFAANISAPSAEEGEEWTLGTHDANTVVLTKTFTTDEKAVTEIKLARTDGKNDAINIPLNGQENVTIGLQVTAIYDDGTRNSNFKNYTLTTAADSALQFSDENAENEEVRNRGISFDDDSETITITPEAAKQITSGTNSTLTLTAMSNANSTITSNLTLTLTREESKATTLVVTAPTDKTVTVPTSDTNATSGVPTVKVLDQYGLEMAGQTITWAFVKAESEADPTGVICQEDGSISVSKGAQTCTVTVKAICDGITYDTAKHTVAYTVTRPAAAATTIEISGSDSIAVPTRTDMTTAVTPATAAYTATVKDQWGNAMEDAAVSWSIPNGTTGVTLNGSTLSVDHTASGTVVLTAQSGEKTATKAITLTKEASQAKFIQITKGEDTAPITTDSVTIPTGDGEGRQQTEVQYTAHVYDQYGQAFTSSVIWSHTYSKPESDEKVTLTNGTLTVKAGANAENFTITAKVSDDVKSELTVTLTNKAVHSLSFLVNEKTYTYGENPTVQAAAHNHNECNAAVTYSVTAGSDVVSISGGTLKLLKPGTATITATVAETDDYAATTAAYTVTVTAKQLTITGLTATNRAYDGTTNVALTGGTLTGIVDSDEVSVIMPTTGSISSAAASETPYTVTVTTPTLTGTKADCYTLADIKNLTVTVSKADSNIGAVTKSSPETIYPTTDLSSITLSVGDPATGTKTAGTATLNAGQALTVGTQAYHWTFKPSDETNYKPATGTIELTVTADSLSGISASGSLSKSSYRWGESLDLSGLTFTATYASGNTKTLSESDLSYSKALTVGQTNVTVSYDGKSHTVTGISVSKADAPRLTDIAVSQKYTVTTGEKAIGTVMPADAGTLTYTKGAESMTGSVTVTSWDVDSTGKVTYALSGGAVGNTVTLPVTISSTNYENATVNVVITLTDKDDQAALTVTGGTTVVYGQTLQLGTSGGSGTGAVTYTVTNGTGEATIDTTGKLTPVKVGSVTVTATKAGDDTYSQIASDPVTVTITRATPTGAPKYTKITSGSKTLADAGLTLTGSTLIPNEGELKWVADDGTTPLADSTVVQANKLYKWLFIPSDTNYTSLTGSVELYHKSSSGGGGGGYTYYTVKAVAGDHGSISPSGWTNVRYGKDQTFTITPDKGYSIAKVLVDGKSVGAVKSYTFENVRKDHTIEAVFMKSNGNPQTGVFVDVPENSYCEAAVNWAVEKGITNGVGDNMFAPNASCTRAQIVTFLWRTAGSPEPKSTTSFTDVPATAYYAKAVAWAVENGVTSGTGSGRFSPDATCTRAQAVTFLYRASGSPAVSGSAEFSDVPATAYYANAVAWAEKNGITTGIGGGLFGSDSDCTRGQIVTFLWRAMAE